MRRTLLALPLLAALNPLTVWAHARAGVAFPAENAVVASPPEIRLSFSEALEPAFSTIQVTDARGKTVSPGRAVAQEPERRILALPLPKLAPGIYTVNWAVVSVDGHRTKGTYHFTVK